MPAIQHAPEVSQHGIRKQIRVLGHRARRAWSRIRQALEKRPLLYHYGTGGGRAGARPPSQYLLYLGTSQESSDSMPSISQVHTIFL